MAIFCLKPLGILVVSCFTFSIYHDKLIFGSFQFFWEYGKIWPLLFIGKSRLILVTVFLGPNWAAKRPVAIVFALGASRPERESFDRWTALYRTSRSVWAPQTERSFNIDVLFLKRNALFFFTETALSLKTCRSSWGFLGKGSLVGVRLYLASSECEMGRPKRAGGHSLAFLGFFSRFLFFLSFNFQIF